MRIDSNSKVNLQVAHRPPGGIFISSSPDLEISRLEVASILRAAVEFGSGAPQADDITVLTIARESTWQVAGM